MGAMFVMWCPEQMNVSMAAFELPRNNEPDENQRSAGICPRLQVSNESSSVYRGVLRSRSAFAITETELKLIAAPAIIGLRSSPKNG